MASNNLQDVILKAIDIVATKKIKQAGYDKTVLATVISCEDEKKGKYKVKYQDSYWIAYSNNINISYTQNSNVYILIPGGDMSKNKTIIGGVKQLGVNYKSLTQEDITNEQVFILQGQNIIDNNLIFSLCSYKQDIKVLYTKQEINNLINIDKDAAKQYFQNCSNFSINMNIQNTLIPQQRYKGNYGIIVGIDFEDNSTGDLVTRYYSIDVDSMAGNPYYFPQEVQQSKVFEIDGQHFIEINSIILFSKDFPIQNEDVEDDIFISNLSIGAVSPLSSDDLLGYSLTLITPRGYIFNESSTNNEERLINAQVRSRGKVLDFETSDIKIFWFRENTSVITSHDKYSKYGGQGWECLNEYGIIEQPTYDAQGNILDPAVYGFRPGSNSFSVKKSDVLAYTTKYKCVAIYDNNILSKEIKIIRQDSDYEFFITSNAGTAFYYDTGSPTLTCYCRQKNNQGTYINMDLSLLKFVWSVTNNVGYFQSLQSIDNVQVDKNKLILIKNSILEYIQIGYLQNQQIYDVEWVFPTDYTISLLEEQIQEQVENIKQNLIQIGITSQNDITNLFSTYLVQTNSGISYDLLLNGDINHKRTLTNAINNYNNFQKIVENQIINLNIKEITKFSTYRCSVFTKQGNQFLGSASITITNSLSAENDYTLIIENGIQVFKYDTTGISPSSKRRTDPQLIPFLSFSIYDSQGNRIDDEITSKCQNSWIVPAQDTLIRPNSSYTEGIPTTDEQDIIYKNLSVFVYSIAETYNKNKTRNNIKLQVNYNGMNLTATTNFSFLKQGEQGTNGTDFVCKIVPNTSNNIPIVPIIYYDGSRVFFNWEQDIEDPWFKIQLWHNDVEPIFGGVTSGNSTEGKFVTVVKWEVLKNIYYSDSNQELNIEDQTNLKIEPTLNEQGWRFSLEEGAFQNSWSENIYTEWRPANIIKVTISYDGTIYYGTLPIVICRLFDNTGLTNVKLKDYGGFNTVLYNSAGMKPQYDNHAPFEIILQNQDSQTNHWEDISLNDEIEYQWFYMGSVFYKNRVTRDWDEVYQETNGEESSKIWLTKAYIGSQEAQKNQKYIKPIDTYNGECLNIGLACKISRNYNNNEEVLAWVHIPIHFYFNRFENSAINSWDGNSINLGGDNGGMILSPQAGSGYKDNNNKFTGVVMGIAKDPNQEVSSQSGLISNYDTGLFGYNSGVRTFFLDSKTGKTTLGQTGQAQIIIDPTQRNAEGRTVAQIRSGNYSQQNETGLLIDLSTPEIRYGSGNFYVTKQGYLYAKGAQIDGTLSVDTQIAVPSGQTFNYSSIRSLGSSLDLKVNDSDFQSTISLLPNQIRLQTSGAIVWNATNSTMDSNGNLWCQNATIQGAIEATSLTLSAQAKSDLESDLGIDSGSTGVYIRKGQLIGASTEAALERETGFIVSNQGLLKAGNAIIWGTIWASNGRFAGEIQSETGNIGGWEITDVSIKKESAVTSGVASTQHVVQIRALGSNGTEPNNNTIAFGIHTREYDGSNYGGWTEQFSITHSGRLYARTADVSGKITATEGKIAYLDVRTDKLVYKQNNSYGESYFTTGTQSDVTILGKYGFQQLAYSSWSSSSSNQGWGTGIHPHGIKFFKFTNSAESSSVFLGGLYGYLQITTGSDTININPSSTSTFPKNVTIKGDLAVQGQKPRVIKTKDYAIRRLSAYETASPLFGDVGIGQINEDGLCYIFIDPILFQTISTQNYYVFLQKEGQGDCFIKDKQQNYFIVKGTPNLSFSWELKAQQADYMNYRLSEYIESTGEGQIDYANNAINYINELKGGRIINENSNINYSI